jgi:hypothetical protein
MTLPTPYAAPTGSSLDDPYDRSSLRTAENAFLWLVTGPRPVSVDGRLFAELPNRPVPLQELRTRLMSRQLQPETRDAIWAHLVARARTEATRMTTRTAHPISDSATTPGTAHRADVGAGDHSGGRSRVGRRRGGRQAGHRHGHQAHGRDRHSQPRGSTWTLACVGVAVPMLAAITTDLATRFRDPADIEAAVLAGFVAEVHRTDVCVPGIFERLRRAAHRTGRQLRDALTASRRLTLPPAPAPPTTSASPTVGRGAAPTTPSRRASGTNSAAPEPGRAPRRDHGSAGTADRGRRNGATRGAGGPRVPLERHALHPARRSNGAASHVADTHRPIRDTVVPATESRADADPDKRPQ